MIMPSLDRHCERSEAIQSGARTLWIAASPAAPRKDGVDNLRGLVASCEFNLLAQRHEEKMKRLQALLSDELPHPNPSPEGEGLYKAISLEGSVG